jgi:transcriptional regulator with XRE-family HTH domain
MKEHRKNLGLSQAKLAEKVYTATAYIGKIEAEQQFPSPEMLERLAQALEIDSPELFSMEPMQIGAIRKLRKDISTDIEAVISTRLKAFEENFWGKS